MGPAYGPLMRPARETVLDKSMVSPRASVMASGWAPAVSWTIAPSWTSEQLPPATIGIRHAQLGQELHV